MSDPTFSITPALIASAQAGDKTAREQVVLNLLPYIRYIARNLAGKHPSEDMVQDGIVGLLEALQRFDPSVSNASFKTFAFYRILGAMKDGLRKEIEYQSHKQSNYLDEFEQPAELAEAPEIPLRCLAERERFVVAAAFGLNGSKQLTPCEIAAHLGLTPQRVHSILKESLAKLAIWLTPSE